MRKGRGGNVRGRKGRERKKRGGNGARRLAGREFVFTFSFSCATRRKKLDSVTDGSRSHRKNQKRRSGGGRGGRGEVCEPAVTDPL